MKEFLFGLSFEFELSLGPTELNELYCCFKISLLVVNFGQDHFNSWKLGVSLAVGYPVHEVLYTGDFENPPPQHNNKKILYFVSFTLLFLSFYLSSSALVLSTTMFSFTSGVGLRSKL